MVPVPLRPVQNWLTILATFLVAGSLFPWNPRLRLGCAGAAVAIVLFLAITRLRAHTLGGRIAPVSVTQARIDRIRAAREARMGRRR